MALLNSGCDFGGKGNPGFDIEESYKQFKKLEERLNEGNNQVYDDFQSNEDYQEVEDYIDEGYLEEIEDDCFASRVKVRNPERFHVDGGFRLVLPDGTADSDFKCEPVSDERMAELNPSGEHSFVWRPIDVTRGEEKHFSLDKPARVNFVIPDEIPEEDYYKLVGIIFDEDGPIYMYPDPEGLKLGVVSFETVHFCETVLSKEDEARLLKEFANRVATYGWQDNMCVKDLKMTTMERLEKLGNKIGFSETDFLGVAVREVFRDNSFVNTAVGLIESDKKDEFIVEQLSDELQEKALSYLFEKWKKYPNNPKLKEYMEEHLTSDNVKDWATELGGGKSPTLLAKEYAKKFTVSKLKDITEGLFPYVKAVKKTVEAGEIVKKFWVNNMMVEMYDAYRNNCNGDGSIDRDFWNALSIRRLSSPQSDFGMTDDEILKMFQTRYKNEQEIAKKQAEIERMAKIWEEDGLLSSPKFRHMDYVQRLNQLHKLTERFRSELVRNGRIPNQGVTSTEDLLEYIVFEYVYRHPDVHGFYDWLRDMGYYTEVFDVEDGNMENIEVEKQDNNAKFNSGPFNVNTENNPRHVKNIGAED